MKSLDWESIASAVQGRLIGRRVVYLPATGSTNNDARRMALDGEPEGTVVLADEQTAGRGRAGKSPWLTPARTSIACSVVLRPSLPAERLALLSMMVGVAAVEAVLGASGVSCALKWPNDVMVGDRKLGGILVESGLTGAAVSYAIAGIGLNGNMAVQGLGHLPDAATPPATLLEAAGAPVSREGVIVTLIEALDRLYASVAGGDAGAVLGPYRAALGTLGMPVRVSGAGMPQPAIGVAEDVTEEGALVLRLPDGTRRTFAHGEVTVRPEQ